MVRDGDLLREVVPAESVAEFQRGARGSAPGEPRFEPRPDRLASTGRGRWVGGVRAAPPTRALFGFVAALPRVEPIGRSHLELLAVVHIEPGRASGQTGRAEHRDRILTTPPGRLPELLDRHGRTEGIDPDRIAVQLRPLLRQMSLHGARIDPMRTAADVEKPLMLALADAVRRHRLRAQGRAFNYRRTTHRADEWLGRHIGERLAITALCNHCRCSRRYLEYAFQHEFGLGPAAYFRTLRLNEARRMLLLRDDRPATVAEVACQLGFGELGRFAGYYRKLFGESPRQSLNGAPAAPRNRLVLLI